MSEFKIDTSEHRTETLSRENLVELLRDKNCKLIESVDFKSNSFKTSYFIGLSRICSSKGVLYVAPKYPMLNYMRMLSVCLEHPNINVHTDQLFNIDLKEAPIIRPQNEDFVTPLMIVEYLRTIKRIVKKGLQKAYFTVEENKRSSVKGKVLVNRNISENHFRNKYLYNWCKYQQFGINNPANRLIKKALRFVSVYYHLRTLKDLQLDKAFNYLWPAFENVGDDVNIDEVRHFKANSFFSEYTHAIQLAKMIIQRFGFSTSTIENSGAYNVQPYWIDMAKLFELYVLSKLQQALPKDNIVFQADGRYGKVDYLCTIPGKEIIIDAKYKDCYSRGEYDIDNIRQLSAYARDVGLLRQLSIDPAKWKETMLSCLIIYPNKNSSKDIAAADFTATPIKEFEQFYKLGVSLP